MKLVLLFIALVGALLVFLSMYVLPYVEWGRGLELSLFIIGVFLVLVALIIIPLYKS